MKALEYFGGAGFGSGGWTDYMDGVYLVAANETIAPGTANSPEYPSLYVYDGENYRAASGTAFFNASGPSQYVNSVKCVWIKKAGVKYAVFSAYLNDGVDNLAIMVTDENLTTSLFQTKIPVSTLTPSSCICRSVDGESAYIAMINSGTQIFVREVDNTGIVTSGTVTPTSTIASTQDILCTASGLAIASVISGTAYPEVTFVNYSFVFQWSQVGTNLNMTLGTLSGNFGLSLWLGPTIVMATTARVTSTFEVTTSCWSVTSGALTEKFRDFHVGIIGRGYTDSTGSDYLPVYSFQTSAAGGAQPFTSIGIINASSFKVNYIGAGFFDRHYVAGLTVQQSPFVNVGGNKWVFCANEPIRSSINNQILLQASKVTLVQVDFNNTDAQYGNAVNLGDSLLSMDGYASVLDGKQYRPAGFYFRPVINVSSATTGGTVAAGTYLFKVVVEYTDSQGNVTIGPESSQFSITTSGSTSTVTIRMRVSKWLGFATVSVYRTLASGSTFYLESSNTIQPDTANWTRTYTALSTSVTTNPLIYTTGGVLENTPPPPTLHASVGQDRIFAVPADEFDKVYYSNKYIAGEVPSFSQFLFIQLASSVPSYRDKITGTAWNGDKLYVFRENSVYWISGDGANLLGEQSTFTDPEILSQDIGCQNPKSIITTPVGVFFKSRKGIWRISSTQLEYVGAPVEAYNSEEVIDSCLIADRNIVLFATSQRLLCYDYIANAWSVDTVAGIASIALWKNKVVALKSDGLIGIEGTGYQDQFDSGVAASNISMKVVSGWIKLSGVQDFGRIYRVLLLGRYFSAHTLTMKVYYDYDDTLVEAFTITPNPAQGAYQFKVHLARQKCEAIKVEVFDTGTGRSMDLTGLTMEVGVKQGTAKINTARQY